MLAPSLPAELLDHIVDLLQDSRDTLKSCCLICKSWIPHTRKHLFAHLGFHSLNNLRAWQTTFPDPSTSPACYAKTIEIGYFWEATAPDAREGGWISSFSRVVHLGVNALNLDNISLVQLHGFSPAMKSLYITSISFPPSRICNLIHSFPLLEDLSLVTPFDLNHSHSSNDSGNPTAPIQFPTLPAFTGFLELSMREMDPIASRLLSPPSGIHFRKMRLTLKMEEDIPSVIALVEGCSSTLETLQIRCQVAYKSPNPIDLSKATKLKDVLFSCKYNPWWIIMSLRTLTRHHRNFHQLSIAAPDAFDRPFPLAFRIESQIRTAVRMEWLSLDSILVQLHESRSIRPKVIRSGWVDKEEGRNRIAYLLPEVVTREIFDLEE